MKLANYTFNTYIDSKLFSNNYYSTLDNKIKLESKRIEIEFFSEKIPFFDSQNRQIALYTDRELNCTADDQIWVFEVETVCRVEWYSGTKTIYYELLENGSVSLLHYWLLHTILPVFFTIEEIFLMMHVGGIEVNDNVILFAAESFGGKSTLVDFFLNKGHTLVTDDSIGIFKKNNDFFAVPSHPYHRPYRKNEDLGYLVKNFKIKPKPIHAIYDLEATSPDSPIEIVEVSGFDKYHILSYSSMITLSFQKKMRFEFLSEMANAIPIFKVKIPWDLKRLPEVYNAIVCHSMSCK